MHNCLVKVTDDIIVAVDKGMVTALVLLDFTKILGMINHIIV